MKKIFILFCLVCLVLIIKYRKKENYMSSSIYKIFAQPFFLGTVNFKRPVNVPLTPFKARKKVVQLRDDDILPPFLIYQTQYLKPVIDQGICGSCWALTVSNILSDRVSVYSNGNTLVNLSSQQLLQCFDPSLACFGASPEEAMQWAHDNNFEFTTDKIIPYNQQTSVSITDTCPQSLSGIGIEENSVVSLVEFIPEHDYDNSILHENIKNMKLELLYNGPFYCAMTVYSDFFTYSGNEIYKAKSDTVDGGHAIEIIGYCDEGVDTRSGYQDGYWICKNTWGAEWPIGSDLEGYFAIRMGYNECGIESRSGSAKPKFTDDRIDPTDYIRYINYNDFISNKKGFFTS